MSIVQSRDGTSIAYTSIGAGPPVVLVDPAGGFRGFGLVTPLAFEPDPEDEQLRREVEELVAAGLRGEAVMHFNRSIGVPEEMLTGIRDQPWWPTMEALAHTLAYDSQLTAEFPVERLAAINTPT